MTATVVPRISVCIVTARRTPLLDACLASLVAQRQPPPFEVLVCSDGDADVAVAVHRRFPAARVCHVASALPGAARNLLIERAEGALLLFLDDDVTVDDDLLARLDRLAEAHPDVDVFGGPNDSPPDSTRFQFVQGAVLASIVASGPVRRRYGAHPAGPADERFFTLCNLAVRRRAMRPFAPDLVCAEENAVLSDMSRRGVRMRYDPSLVAYHERRPTLGGFARQMHKYGRGRGQLTRRVPTSVRPAHLVPSALLAYLLLVPLAAMALGPLVVLPALCYLAAVAAAAAWIARTVRRPLDVPLATLLMVVLHACYGAGVLRGLADARPPDREPEVLNWSEPAPPPTAIAAPAALDR